MKTVLITGTSSGIGKATARYFAENGWNVAATMRTPAKETELTKLPNVKLFRLDVMDADSIRQAIADARAAFGGIDAIVNNAGYGAVGAFEAATPEQVQRQFDTNVFGVMNVIREILPYFREKRDGTIINVTSMGGLITFPSYSIYHGTKWAVEGFAEALSFELRPFNIRVKNVEPGAIKTDFYDRSQDVLKKDGLTAYDEYVRVTLANTQKEGENAPGPEVVAKTIFKAANDRSFRLRYVTGNSQTGALLTVRRLIPLSWFHNIVRGVVEKGYKAPAMSVGQGA
ncbi:short-chain dehydrogenase/reductase SDR [Fibrisoma limi BUZ 3]|uniref:Short-chain dehydrogenase/reductase SDR n=1 Tax=Fibrisoma limi BUZ 3 TaxID=1185876 RepID=I2GCK4_9BACT|nr:SDR family oxidoreductase [Fibrisoma limi]CCH51628.1 short-chain dehydrogenase/reductase SDR [Fibrisoma limi BUZ 3]